MVIHHLPLGKTESSLGAWLAILHPHNPPVRICVIFNPTAKGDKARHFRQHLSEIASDCVFKPTNAPGAASALAKEAVEEGFEVVVAAGGDGTVNEVLSGLAETPDAFAKTRFGVIPLGTVNVFAREYEIPFKLKGAWEVICSGYERPIDVPLMEFNRQGETSTKAFAQMAGAGLDARAVELVSWSLKKKIGRFAYIVAGLKAISGPLPQITCRADGQAASGELVLLGNGRFYGGSLPVFHQADPADGLVDACVYPKVSWTALFRYGWGYLTGRVHPPPDMRYLRAKEIELISASRVPVELDGEFVGELPAKVSVMATRVRVMSGKKG